MYANNQIKEVFVFGAGASNASARTPLGKNLGWTYYEDCSTWYEIENGKPANHDLKERNTRFVNYGKFLQLGGDVYPGLNEFKRWQECMKNGADYSFLAEKDKYVDEMVKILQGRENTDKIELIRQIVFEHIVESDKYDNKLYKKFVESLTGKSPENISIISFNFDYLLKEDFRSFDYLINFDDFNDIATRDWYDKKNGIHLIKLNGSLNWAICPKCRRITLIFPLLNRDSYDNRPCNKGCRGELRPYIFLPHEGKDESVSPLWEKAREVLKQAGKITVIGYSFPSYDEDVTNLFKEYTSNDAILEIVDYAEDADKNNREKGIREKEIREWLQNIFSKRDMKVSLYGFEGYIKETQMQ